MLPVVLGVHTQQLLPLPLRGAGRTLSHTSPALLTSARKQHHRLNSVKATPTTNQASLTTFDRS